jgi:ankyrin repeat protein
MKPKPILIVSGLLFLAWFAGPGRADPVQDIFAALRAGSAERELQLVTPLLNANLGLVNAKDNQGNTPLFYAGFKKVAELFLAKGADVNVRNNYGETPLFYTSKEVAELLLARGADVNAKANAGETPLLAAARSGNKGLVEFLLNKGAEANVKNSRGETLLNIAASYDRKDVVEFLLNRGSEVNPRDNYGYTPLHGAAGAINTDKDVVELLLNKGAEVNARTASGDTPLHKSIWHSSSNNDYRNDRSRLLLARGAEVNARNNDGETPLFTAASYGHKTAVELLLSRGAEINARNKGGRTPLFKAASNGRKDVVEFLLNNGADVNVKDSKGMTPLQVAEKEGRTDISELLRHPVTNAADVALDEALAAARQKQWAVAIRHFLEAQALKPAAPEVLFNLGLAESKVPGRELRAMAWLQAYLLAAPNAANATAVRTEIASLKVRVGGAVEKLVGLAKQQAGQFSDDYEKKRAFCDVAIAQARSGDTDGAEQTLRKVGVNGLAQAKQISDLTRHYIDYSDLTGHYIDYEYKPRHPLSTAAKDRLDELLILVGKHMSAELFTDPQSALQTIAAAKPDEWISVQNRSPLQAAILIGTVKAIEQLADALNDLKALSR